MGCGDMPHMRRKKETVPEMEFTTLFIVAFWAFWISLIALVVLGGLYLFITLILILGSFRTEPERPQIETKPVQTYIQPIRKYEFEIEPVKVERPKVGCEYWYGVVDQLEANATEKKWLKDIIFCESTCNPNAVSYAGATGLLQFMPRTWNWQGGGDINNPYEQIEKGLEMYRKGMANHWCCNSII